MAFIQQNSSDYFGSKETITEALVFLQPSKEKKYIASAYNLLADNYQHLLNNKDAIVYFKKAIEETNSASNKLVFMNNLATSYIENNEYEKAISILNTILSDSITIHNPIKKARVLDNLTYAQWLKDDGDVSASFLKALEIRKENNDKRGLIASYTHLGEFYTSKNKQKAVTWFHKAIKASKRIKNPRGELDALNFLMNIQPNNLKIKTRYIVLNDSLQKQELKVKTQFAKIQYDAKIKNEEIEKLKNITEQQQLDVSIQRRQKIIYLLAGIILIIIVTFYLYYLFQKHKADKEKKACEIN